MTGGVSCQPFSALGDRREQEDPRAESFPGLLVMAYYLGSLALIVECTKEAKDSPRVQEWLQAFSSQTGYVLQQEILQL